VGEEEEMGGRGGGGIIMVFAWRESRAATTALLAQRRVCFFFLLNFFVTNIFTRRERERRVSVCGRLKREMFLFRRGREKGRGLVECLVGGARGD
jgi:hypothetical protein